MKAKANQLAAERNIAMVTLADIQPSSFNPRRRFDEATLYGLAESIKRRGASQPITVCPVDGTGRYGTVFGERRYHASVIAGRNRIPVIVIELSDEEAEEMTITEDLQRKDVTPMKEAAAYQRLIKSGRHTTQTLTQLFGKNENYIHIRLRFTVPIPEIAALLEADELTISVTAEVCRYGGNIQREVYEKHLQDEGTYSSWRGLRAINVARRIEQSLATDLQYYRFDKTKCTACTHNTNNLLLFRDGGCGHCASRTCLAEMNASYLMRRAVQIMQTQPGVSLCHDRYCTNKMVAERLTVSGYEAGTFDRYTAFPNCLKEPKAENFNDPERYGEIRTRYEQRWTDCMEREEGITHKSEAEEITIYAKIGQKETDFCYVENVTEARTADGTPAPAPLSPVEKLEKQDGYNKEITLERTMEGTKKQVLEADITGGKFSANEDTTLYFFPLSSLRKEHFTTVGIAEDKQHITDEDKMGIIDNLTVRMKTITRRNFLVANFKGAYGNDTVTTLLPNFARGYMPEELANIKREYDGVYEKRHRHIEEKEAIPLVQGRTRERKVTRPKEGPRAEEIAA